MSKQRRHPTCNITGASALDTQRMVCSVLLHFINRHCKGVQTPLKSTRLTSRLPLCTDYTDVCIFVSMRLGTDSTAILRCGAVSYVATSSLPGTAGTSPWGKKQPYIFMYHLARRRLNLFEISGHQDCRRDYIKKKKNNRSVD